MEQSLMSGDERIGTGLSCDVRTDVRTDFVIVRTLETSGNEGQDFTSISDIEIHRPEGAAD